MTQTLADIGGVAVRVRGQLKHLPGCRVVLGPHTDEFVKVMRSQDGGVSRQILKVVHNDGDEEVQHLDNVSNK